MKHIETRFEGTPGTKLAALLDTPDGTPRAYALFAHCFTCTKDIYSASQISAELTQQGYAVLRFDFTGLGHSEGEFASTNFSSNIEDLIAAAHWLEANHKAPQLLIGHSLGGAAVLAAAHRLPSVRAVATIAAPAEPSHIEALFTGSRPEIESRGEAEVYLAGRPFTIRRQFLEDVESHKLAHHVAELHRALIVFHAPTDETVSVDNAARIFAAAKHPKSFISLDHADHLLRKGRDAQYVARVLAAWAEPYMKTE